MTSLARSCRGCHCCLGLVVLETVTTEMAATGTAPHGLVCERSSPGSDADAAAS